MRSLPKEPLPELERKLIEFWRTQQIFARSIEQRKEGPYFSHYDGPPFATGLPHYGHLLAGTIKDSVCRYKTMRGYYAPRRFGWDCHGIPVEHEIEKSKGIWGAQQIEEYGVAAFNEACRSIVHRYAKEWELTVERMGRWVDFSHNYQTMDLTFMESIWWVFKQLFDQGFVYEGYRVLPFSAQLGTPLSNFEAGENYKEVDDPSLTVKLPLLDEKETSLLIWTTTPWTLPSNLAVMVGGSLSYLKVRSLETGETYILAEERLSAHFGPESVEILERLDGHDLEGRRYEPPFPYFRQRSQEGAFRIILGKEVTTGEGTGIVHCSPAFGEADFEACKEAGIELVCPVDKNGRFTEEIPDLAGQFVKDADRMLIARLKEEGKLFRRDTIRHRYPFCPRSDTPIIYRVIHTWFVKVEEIRDRLIRSNEQIHWVPHHLKEGRFGKWLEQARDWNIARNRYWGTPIPLWRSESGKLLALGSLEELEKWTGVRPADLHRHHIDPLTIEHEGETYRRVEEVFDCWFESGSMPYAQIHYPFENRELFEKGHPAEFIAEGLDQTRGWFYTLTILSTILFNQPAFKNLIVNGILLAEDGTKMSKRLKNYPPPEEVIEKYGADAIRLYLLNSPAVRADDLRFSERGVELTLRQLLLPLWNATSFLLTYAEIYQWSPQPLSNRQPIDQWILSRLQQVVEEVNGAMDEYALSQAVAPFLTFIEDLTNWYIRLNRRRFWEGDPTLQSEAAFQTLYEVLLTFVKVLAPFAPFLSETIYQLLRPEESAESVHLTDFPTYQAEKRHPHLEQEMEAMQTVVRLGHALRKEKKQKVRQPLPALHIISSNQHLLQILKSQCTLIAQELNVKEILFSDQEAEAVLLRPKPNFRLLGKRVGKLMPLLHKEITNLSQTELERLQQEETITLIVGGERLTLSADEISVEREVREGLAALNSEELTVLLDTRLTEELEREGLARELINRISTMRREASLNYTDRIAVEMEITPRLRQAYESHREMIHHELLALSFTFGAVGANGKEWECNGEACKIAITAHPKDD